MTEWNELADQERRESPDGRTGFERLVERDRLVERRAHPRRRADDWKEESPIKLRNLAFKDLATKLGYAPDAVMSIRMNPREIIVTVRRDGLPRSIRHELVDE